MLTTHVHETVFTERSPGWYVKNDSGRFSTATYHELLSNSDTAFFKIHLKTDNLKIMTRAHLKVNISV